MSKYVGPVEFPCEITLGRGLEGAITNVTKIGAVNGVEGKLIYRGYDIKTLCDHSNYEEVAYLLIYGNLPTQSEMSAFSAELKREGEMPAPIMRMIEGLPRDAHPMNALQAAVAAAGCFDKEGWEVTKHTSDPAAALEIERKVGIRILARTRSFASAIARAQMGKDLLQPNPDLGFTANYLYMMSGEVPDETMCEVMDVCLILQADHGMNASTFTSMVVHSSLADMYSTMAAAIGSLRGPLHGGANEAALNDFMSIGGPDKAAAWVEQRFAQGKKIIGFGHRVYKALDPRAVVLKQYAEKLCREKGFGDLYDTVETVERETLKRMEAAGKKIYPNVDYYSGLVYHALGFPTQLFPVIFAVARTAGWLARVLEYLPENRIFRPRAVYDGASDLKYVPMGER